jgi:hypothetical protein
MAENTKENGKTIIWRELVFMFGTMAVNMKVNTKMIRSMALVFIHGQTAENMKDIGGKVNNME